MSSTDPSTQFPEDDLKELESFRQQWKAEVSSKARAAQGDAKTSGPSASSESSNQTTQARTTAIGPPRLRRLSSTTKDKGKAVYIPDDDDIEHFRRKTDIQPTSALEHYERAVEEETQGSLGESLKYYRKAFKMEPDVHEQYKEKHFPKAKAPVLRINPTAGPSGSKVLPSKSKDSDLAEKKAIVPEEPALKLKTVDLVATFSNTSILPATSLVSSGNEEAQTLPCPISQIPHEILLQILHRLASTNIPGFVRLAQTCKSLCWLVYTEDRIWKDICTRTWGGMCWGPDWHCTVDGNEIEDDPSDEYILDDVEQLIEETDALAIVDPITEAMPSPVTDDLLLKKYKNDWRRMFIERPRVRFNGVYISTCAYQRPGHSTLNTVVFSTPIHIVTYYRYLRFYPNGFVLSLLTTTEPQDVVHSLTLDNYHLHATTRSSTHTTSHFHGHGHQTSVTAAAASNAHLKNILPGRWKLSPDLDTEGKLSIETEGPGPIGRYLYGMELWIKMRPKGVVGKVGGGDILKWGGFWSYNRVTDDRGEFGLKNDKPFHFSRVKGYEREMGLV